MTDNGENAPLSGGSLAGSANPLLRSERSRGGSNRRALRVAGLTTLACVLLGVQAFVAYMVYDQRQQINTLKKNIDVMNRQMRAPQAVAPVRMREPLGFQMMDTLFSADSAVPEPNPNPNPRAAVKQEKNRGVSASVGVEEMMSLMEENFELPNFNDTILGNLQGLRREMNQSNWKSFESWLRNWILFEMAQHKSVLPTGDPASPTKTKCQMHADAVGSQPPLFRPACDERGRYRATQCWRAVGVCWCVDVRSGAAITGTATRSHYLECGFEA